METWSDQQNPKREQWPFGVGGHLGLDLLFVPRRRYHQALDSRLWPLWQTRHGIKFIHRNQNIIMWNNYLVVILRSSVIWNMAHRRKGHVLTCCPVLLKRITCNHPQTNEADQHFCRGVQWKCRLTELSRILSHLSAHIGWKLRWQMTGTNTCDTWTCPLTGGKKSGERTMGVPLQ